MADPVRKMDRHYTYRDYKAWPDDERWELIDGVAWNMSPAPTTGHQRILGDLYNAFRTAAMNDGCEVLFAPVDVFLLARSETSIDDADTIVQPDLLVVCDETKVVPRGCLGAPDVAVEVLSTYTMRKDITVKRDLYERAGVGEYWIVDPGNQAIMIFRLDKSGRYPEDPIVIQSPGSATSAVLQDLCVTLPFA